MTKLSNCELIDVSCAVDDTQYQHFVFFFAIYD